MAKFKKGSAAAKAFMAKLRSMQGGKKRKVRASRIVSKRRGRRTKTSRLNPSLQQLTREISALRKKGRSIVKKSHTKIKPYYFTGGDDQIIIEGGRMARRKTRRKARRVHGFEGRRKRRVSRRMHGFAGGRRSRRRTRRGLLMGGGMSGIVPMLTQGAVGAAGAIGSAYVANMIPNVPPKIKPAIPLALAIGLLMFGKKIPMSKPLAFGAAISGIMGFAKQFVPTMPTLAGVDSAPELSADEALMLGAPQSFGDDMGSVQTFGAMSPADI
jgi:hypothetical protein